MARNIPRGNAQKENRSTKFFFKVNLQISVQTFDTPFMNTIFQTGFFSHAIFDCMLFANAVLEICFLILFLFLDFFKSDEKRRYDVMTMSILN